MWAIRLVFGRAPLPWDEVVYSSSSTHKYRPSVARSPAKWSAALLWSKALHVVRRLNARATFDAMWIYSSEPEHKTIKINITSSGIEKEDYMRGLFMLNSNQFAIFVWMIEILQDLATLWERACMRLHFHGFTYNSNLKRHHFRSIFLNAVWEKWSRGAKETSNFFHINQNHPTSFISISLRSHS